MPGWHFERAVVHYVVDGDTIRLLRLDQGLDHYTEKLRVRFLHAWAEELKNKDGTPNSAGKAAKAHLETLVKPGDVVEVRSAKWDRYARRIDGEVYLADGRELGELQIAAGHAERR